MSLERLPPSTLVVALSYYSILHKHHFVHHRPCCREQFVVGLWIDRVMLSQYDMAALQLPTSLDLDVYSRSTAITQAFLHCLTSTACCCCERCSVVRWAKRLSQGALNHVDAAPMLCHLSNFLRPSVCRRYVLMYLPTIQHARRTI